MKRSPFVLLAALCGLASPPALAATPTPPCTSYAGLADADKDGFCSFVGAATATTSGWTGKVDCDDAKPGMNPGASEIVGDGIDQDCSGADLTLPVSDQTWKWFVADEYKGRAPNPNLFVAEYDACTAATTARCEIVVGNGDGHFKIVDPDKDVFADIKVKGTAVLRNNRQPADGREVVSIEDFQHFRGGSASGSGTGPSKATRAKETTAIVTPLVTAETEARLHADAAHDQRLGVIETGNAGRDGEINRLADVDAALEGRIAASEDALAVEAKARAEADLLLAGAVDDASRRAKAASETASSAASVANSAASHGPLFEGYGMANVMVGSPVNDDGDVARGSTSGGGGAGVNVGVDGSGYRANAFGDIAFGADGSDLAINWAAGGEYLWQLGDSPAHLGPNAGFAQRSSNVNELETQVLGRMPMAGLTLAVPFAHQDNGQHGVFLVRTGFGPEFIGMSGDSVTSDVAFGGRFTIGIGFGAGALR